jgi:galactokinase
MPWGTYPLTVVRRLTRNFPGAGRGADIVFDSDLPPAAGMSSSSALMIAVLLAIVRANRLDSSSGWTDVIHDRADLAAYAAAIENGASFRSLIGGSGVGTAGGSEDHVAILCCQPGALARFSFCPIGHEQTITLPPGLVFAVGVSGVEARKTGEARDDYNRASNDVRRILDTWREATGRDDDSLAAVLDSSVDAADRLRSLMRGGREEAAARLEDRLDHFIQESTVIVASASEQLAAGDLAGFGTSVDQSQELAERLLRNQVDETIRLVRSARDLGAIAASAFGAGFGGSVWALVERRGAEDFVGRWADSYRASCPHVAGRAAFLLTSAGPAAMEISLEDVH